MDTYQHIELEKKMFAQSLENLKDFTMVREPFLFQVTSQVNALLKIIIDNEAKSQKEKAEFIKQLEKAKKSGDDLKDVIKLKEK